MLTTRNSLNMKFNTNDRVKRRLLEQGGSCTTVSSASYTMAERASASLSGEQLDELCETFKTVSRRV